MKIEPRIKTKRQQVFEILDKKGFILDDEAVKILGNENLCNISEYVRMWKAYTRDVEYFENKEIVEKHKSYRKHLVRLKGCDSWLAVSKQFFDTVKL